MSLPVDRPQAVRPGEQLAEQALRQYLAQEVGLEGPLSIEQFVSGYSNLTYLLRVGEHELVLRRPPFGSEGGSAHDMGREFTILSRLAKVYPKVPRPVHYCADPAVLGAPFYVMERVRGMILRGPEAAQWGLDAAWMQDIARAWVAELAALHALDIEAAGLADIGRPQGYVRRQIEGWQRRYRRAQTHDVPALERAGAWLAEHMPPESGATLIHNDYKYDNVVLSPHDGRTIIAVLDWEMATVGDPLMDLGTSLGYWLEPNDPDILQQIALSPTTLPGNPTRAEVVAWYEQHSGRTMAQPVFYFVYGLFKVAVIMQQLFARYQAGYSKDARFAVLIHGVRACGDLAQWAIQHERLSW